MALIRQTSIDSLESLAMQAYLDLLESFAKGFVQISRTNSRLAKSVAKNALKAVRSELDGVCRSTAGSSLRQSMIDK